MRKEVEENIIECQAEYVSKLKSEVANLQKKLEETKSANEAMRMKLESHELQNAVEQLHDFASSEIRKALVDAGVAFDGRPVVVSNGDVVNLLGNKEIVTQGRIRVSAKSAFLGYDVTPYVGDEMRGTCSKLVEEVVAELLKPKPSKLTFFRTPAVIEGCGALSSRENSELGTRVILQYRQVALVNEMVLVVAYCLEEA